MVLNAYPPFQGGLQGVVYIPYKEIMMQQKRKIILASSSPRRKELLEKLGLVFTVEPSHYPEDLTNGSPRTSGTQTTPEGLVKSISIGKATTVGQKYPDALIISADTIGVIRGKVSANRTLRMKQKISWSYSAESPTGSLPPSPFWTPPNTKWLCVPSKPGSISKN